MTHAKFVKLLSSLAADAASAARDAADMLEINEGDTVDPKTAMALCNRLRERILWIERTAFDVKDPR